MREKWPHLTHCSVIRSNNRFEVQFFQCNTSIGGVWQLGIVRHGDIEGCTWSEIQRIVHELFSPEVTAVEVYPPVEHEWHSRVNLRVIWVLPMTWELPFGLHKMGAWGKPAE